MGRRFLVAAVGAVSLLLVASVAGALGQDPGLPQQWALAKIGAPSAWARSVGAGVPVAIVDTGIDFGHDDLKDQLMARVTCVNTGGDPKKCVVDGADIEGHGTHVAGIAAAASNNAGVAGVAPGARIVAVRVFQVTESEDPVTHEKTKDYYAKSSDIEAGIHWVIANIATKGAINLSLGGDFVVTNIQGGASFSDAVEAAWRAGWVTVLASGNENLVGGLGSQNYGTLDALVVGATGPDDEIADYSSPTGNAKWALLAPGGNTNKSDAEHPEKSPCELEPAKCVLSDYLGNAYALAQGTSMATPHVTGTVALLMSGGMTNAQAVQRILDTADRRIECDNHCVGRLDVNKAVPADWKASSGPSPTTTVKPGSAMSAPATATTSRPASSGTTASGGSRSSVSSSRARAGSPASSVVVVSPAEVAAGSTSTTAVSDNGAEDGAAAPKSSSTPASDDDGPPAVLVLVALALAAAVGTGAGVLARRRRGQRRLSTVTTLP